MHHGSLWRSILHHNATKDSVEVGSNMVYSLIHHFGGKAGRKRKVTIPARPFLGVSEQEKAKIENYVKAWIQELLAAK
jgi:phage virion morphogenesis protein